MSELNKSEKNDFVLYRIAECSKKTGNDDAVYWYLELLNNIRTPTSIKNQN